MHPSPDGHPEVDRLPVGHRAGGKSCQYSGIHFEDGDLRAREAGTNGGRIAWAKAVTDFTGPRSDRTCLGQPALTPEGAAMATDASDREQQQRELEEIRRKFTEIGTRMGSMFEPAPADDDNDDVQPTRPALPAPEQPAPQPRPLWLMVAGVALVFLLGAGFGYILPRVNAKDSAPPRAPAASTPAPAPSTRASQPGPAAKAVVPPACLETARRADEVISLLNRNIRTRRLAEALKDYTLASQACREEASP
jgi:hypothetical protein